MSADLAEPDERPHLVWLCTGNAARSVMAALMLAERDDRFRVTGAGTHAIEGLPMSQRTREALAGLGLADPGHRSRQLTADHVVDAILVVAFEPNHVRYVRRLHPAAAARTATLPRLVRDLAPGPADLRQRIRDLDLAAAALEPWEEVADPAGGDATTFSACASQVSVLVDALRAKL